MSCCIHYDNYTGEGDKLLPLSDVFHKRLLDAKESRKQLGGNNVHPQQGNNVPEVFQTGSFYHQKC